MDRKDITFRDYLLVTLTTGKNQAEGWRCLGETRFPRVILVAVPPPPGLAQRFPVAG